MKSLLSSRSLSLILSHLLTDTIFRAKSFMKITSTIAPYLIDEIGFFITQWNLNGKLT